VSYLERRKEVTSGGKGGACGHTTKSVAKRVEEKSGACPMTKSTETLWRGHSRRGIPVRVGVVYKEGDSVICGV